MFSHLFLKHSPIYLWQSMFAQYSVCGRQNSNNHLHWSWPFRKRLPFKCRWNFWLWSDITPLSRSHSVAKGRLSGFSFKIGVFSRWAVEVRENRNMGDSQRGGACCWPWRALLRRYCELVMEGPHEEEYRQPPGVERSQTTTSKDMGTLVLQSYRTENCHSPNGLGRLP